MRLQRLEEQKRVMAATLLELEAEVNPATLAAEAVRALDKQQERREGAEGDAGRRALDDLELGRSFHQLESALRMRGAPQP